MTPPPLSLFQPVLNASSVQPPSLNQPFMDELKSSGVPFSLDAEDRVFRAHGEAFWEGPPEGTTSRGGV